MTMRGLIGYRTRVSGDPSRSLASSTLLTTSAPIGTGLAKIGIIRRAAAILTDISDRFRLAKQAVTVLACVALYGAPTARVGLNSYNPCYWVALTAAVTLFHDRNLLWRAAAHHRAVRHSHE
jgi:hypothetical protein